MSASDEFMEDFGEWGRDGNGNPLPCTIRTHTGDGSMGRIFAEPVDRPGMPQFPQNRLVRTPDGNEILSSTALYLPIEDLAIATLGSEVILRDGRTQTMETVAVADADGLYSFVQVNLA